MDLINALQELKQPIIQTSSFIGIFSLLLLLRSLSLKIIFKLIVTSSTKKDDAIWENKFFHHFLNLVVIACLIGVAPLCFTSLQELQVFERLLNIAFIILLTGLTVNTLNFFNFILSQNKKLTKFPLRSFFQTAKLFLLFIAALLIIARLFNQNILGLLSGIGALAAVLSFVFKDLLLSLVASIQNAIFDLIRVGDWIEMPSHQADGDVIDISLTTIRIQNWDKTTVAIPSQAIISSPFKNWRGMSQLGARRMKKSILLDVSSIFIISDQFLEALQNHDHLNPEILRIISQEIHLAKAADTHRPVTNSNVFRLYLQHYLHKHPLTQETLTLMVRFLPINQHGLPLEIYCFNNQTEWTLYENFQAEIIEFILACLPLFKLKAFQAPSGSDLTNAFKKG